ncbi:acyl-homoserine-lactone synthase [Novosphingobium sp. PS1R-30]|uniref:Acyl-homoserine-lactone synthase n=1 Tax=Novosphingobium anseongense TaxID=3133436 RepID=A0ABU8RU12_9SPHN
MIRTIDRMSEAEGAVLRSMFEARKRVFVDLLKWDVPVLAGTWEIDHFDDRDATYLILTDGESGHVASTRLLETTRPHLLDSLFPQLVDGPIPAGRTVREITRFCLDRSLRAAERRQARDWLVSALAAHALERGITHYTGVAELPWFQQIRAFGWNCLPLGAPMRIDGRMLTALVIAIDEDTPERLADRGIWRTGMAVPAGLARDIAPEHRA